MRTGREVVANAVWYRIGVDEVLVTGITAIGTEEHIAGGIAIATNIVEDINREGESGIRSDDRERDSINASHGVGDVDVITTFGDIAEDTIVVLVEDQVVGGIKKLVVVNDAVGGPTPIYLKGNGTIDGGRAGNVVEGGNGMREGNSRLVHDIRNGHETLIGINHQHGIGTRKHIGEKRRVTGIGIDGI